MSKTWRLLRWIVLSLSGLVIAFCAVFVGAAYLCFVFSQNADWQPSTAGIDIYLIRNGAHVDIVLPTSSHGARLHRDLVHPEVASEISDAANYLVLGWGEREVYPNTPTWAHLSFGRAARALLWPTDAVLHVTVLDRLPARATLESIRLSQRQFASLIRFVLKSVATDSSGRAQPIFGARFSQRDGFFAAHGRYHLFNTCNNWTARALREAGVRAPAWAPFSFWVAPLVD